MAVLRAEAFEERSPVSFLNDALALLHNAGAKLEIAGPFPAPVEKRAGRYRFQLLLQSNSRAALQRAIQPWMLELEQLKPGKKIRWSLDVDPQEIL